MKLKIPQKALLRGLDRVIGAVERRNTIPILANVHIKADASGLHLKTSDLDIEVTAFVEAEVKTEGETTVQAHMLRDIVKRLRDDGEVSMELNGKKERIRIITGRSNFELAVLGAKDFPSMNAGEFEVEFQIEPKTLKDLFEKTKHSISTETTRYYLNGTFLHTLYSGGIAVLRAVSTDGHRLARTEVPAPEGCEKMPAVIVPTKTSAEVSKLLTSAVTPVTVAVSSAKIRFTIEGTAVTSKLIDGIFPDYQRLVPEKPKLTAKVEQADLQAAIARVSVLSSDKARAVKFALNEGTLHLSVRQDDGQGAEEIDAEFNGKEFETGFNSRYILDILDTLDGDATVIGLTEPSAPATFRDRDDESTLHLCMPMRA
jgi:DNA polymerase-3 subunit beta